ncbi:MAG TPA: hypothetical protein VH278_03930 [Burkholderiaceae bacterium]|nr:hypothetical protein [Burkholderiaceae bacterium]
MMARFVMLRFLMARFVLSVLPALLAAPDCARAEPGTTRLVAIVTEVEGSARLIIGSRVTSPEVADPVEQGVIVVLERNARIVLTYPVGGAIYELHGPGRFVVQSEAVQARGGSGRLARRDLIPALRALRIQPDGSTLQGSAAMRGTIVQELEPEGPRGTQLARDPIRLCWRSLGPQWNYRVRLIDDEGSVLFETRTADPAFELPATVPLQPNVPYLWHVMAIGPYGQSSDGAGQFRRLDPDSEQALLTAESLAPDLDQTGRTLIRIARQQLGFTAGGAVTCSPPAPAPGRSNSAVSE